MLSDQTAEHGSRPDILDTVWRLAISGTIRIVLLALLAFSLVVGSLLPQLPAAIAGDPAAAAANRWLTTSASHYGSWGSLLRTAGVFDIARAAWFRLLLTVLAFHLLLNAAESAQTAYPVLTQRWPLLPSSSGALQRGKTSLPPPLGAAADILQARLEARGAQVLRDAGSESETAASLYAYRARPGVLGALLWSIGALSILLGLFVSQARGWRTAELLLVPGVETPVGHETHLSLRLDRGALPGAGAQLLILDHQDRVTAQPFGPARPARLGTIFLHHTGDGPALVVEATDSRGRPVTVQSPAGGPSASDRSYLIFDRPQAERHLTIPDLDLALRVVAQGSPTPGEPSGEMSFAVEGYEVGTALPVIEALVGGDGATLSVRDGQIVLAAEQYSVLQAAHTPGVPWLLAGGLLVLVGVTLPLVWPTLQVWAALTPSRRAVAVELLTRPHSAFLDMELEMEQLAEPGGGNGGPEE